MADPSQVLAQSIAQGIQLGQFLGNAGQRVQQNAQNSFLRSQQAFENQIKLGEQRTKAIESGLRLGQDLKESEQRLALAGQAATQRAEAGDRAQRGLELREIGLANDIDVEIAKKRSKLESLRAAHEANDRLRGTTTPFTAGATLEAEIQALEQNKSRLNLEDLPLGELRIPTAPEGEILPGQLLLGDFNKDGTRKTPRLLDAPTDAELDAIANPGLAIQPVSPITQPTQPEEAMGESQFQPAEPPVPLGFSSNLEADLTNLGRASAGEQVVDPSAGSGLERDLANLGRAASDRGARQRESLSIEEIGNIPEGQLDKFLKKSGLQVIKQSKDKIMLQDTTTGRFIPVERSIEEPDLSATGRESASDPDQIVNQFDADRALIKGLETLDQATDLRVSTRKKLSILERQLKQVKSREKSGIASADLIRSLEDKITESEVVIELIDKREKQIEADEKAKKNIEDKKVKFADRNQAVDTAWSARNIIGNLGIASGSPGGPMAVDDPEFNKFISTHRSSDDLRRKLINIMRAKSNADSKGEAYPDIEESIDFLQSSAGKDAVKALWESENWLRANKKNGRQRQGTTDNPSIEGSPEDIIKNRFGNISSNPRTAPPFKKAPEEIDMSSIFEDDEGNLIPGIP